MTTKHQIQDAIQVNRFVFAGDSTFTIRSAKTDTSFTFKVSESEDGRVHFVKVLTGPNNSTDFRYLGLFKGPDFIHDGKWAQRAKGGISPDAPSAKAFRFFSECLKKGKFHEALEFYHEGKCGRCNRKLTTPASVLTGIGPECCEIMGIEQVQPPMIAKEEWSQESPLDVILSQSQSKFTCEGVGA